MLGNGRWQILKEFPGPDGLIEFARWWRKTQAGDPYTTTASPSFCQRFVHPMLHGMRWTMEQSSQPFLAFRVVCFTGQGQVEAVHPA